MQLLKRLEQAGEIVAETESLGKDPSYADRLL